MNISLLALYAALGTLRGMPPLQPVRSAAYRVEETILTAEYKAQAVIITDTKAIYIAFLACAQAAEADPAGKAQIATSIGHLRDIPDEHWDQIKVGLRVSASDFAARYGDTCLKK